MFSRRAQTVSSTSTVLVTLALFIILLSFFIILNSHSIIKQDKASSILMSVEEAFTGRVFANGGGPSQRADNFLGKGEGAVLEKTNDLFRSRFPAIKTTNFNTAKGLFFAELPYDSFSSSLDAFMDKSGTGDAAIENFFSYLINSSKDDSYPFRIEIYVYLPQPASDMVTRERPALEEFRHKAAILAGKLQAAGLNTNHLTVGLKEGQADDILFVMRKVIEINPAATGGE